MNDVKRSVTQFSDIVKSVEGVHIGQIRQEIDSALQKFKNESSYI